MRNYVRFLAIASIGLVMTGCSDQQKPKSVNYTADALRNDQAEIQRAYCSLKGTKDKKIEGTVSFSLLPDNSVKIVADVHGLTPGKHGFHIHEKGDCGNDGEAAGSHFNPSSSKHGGPDSAERHAGDLGNLEAGSDGKAHYERIDKVIKLNGPESIVGRALIVHEKEDDFKTQPTGASGAKVACGVIRAE